MTINAYFGTVGVVSWTVPSDWNNSNNYMAVIGAGGGDSCGGGGGFASQNNVVLTPGAKVYIRVGKGGIWPVSGGNTWINKVANAQPTSGAQGILGSGGITDYLEGIGYYGNVNFNGGRGSVAGPGGGAGGPHGAGGWATAYVGGAGDAGYGGAGGYDIWPEYYYASINGLNGTEWGSYGSGGGGGMGAGGYYGGGGGEYGYGAQGIAMISYTPAPVIVPPPPEPPPANGGGVCDCLLPVFNPGEESTGSAKAFQYYWAYGAWSNTFVGSSHFDANYMKLGSLVNDNDTPSYDNQYDLDTRWSCTNEQENQFSDYPRVWKSRSNEWLEDAGQRSAWMRHRVTMANTFCVPDSEPSLGYVTCTTNQLYMDEQTYGWKLSYSSLNGMFTPGDIVAQEVNDSTTTYGTVYMVDPNYIWINIPVGMFFGGLSVYNAVNPAVNAWVIASTAISERFSSNVFPGQSRYISKSTMLATGQDAEDIRVLMVPYRPANTNFKVYAKTMSGNDPNVFEDRIWTRLVESNNTSSKFSSATNLNDFVDVLYDFPKSQILYGNVSGCGCNSESLFVTVPSTKSFYTGLAIYLTDPSTSAFNVRTVGSIVNDSMIQLISLPSFSNTTNVNIGVIPDLETETGSFLYDQNSNIARYCTPDDIFFDSFNQFAVKIVPISDNPTVVPRVTNLRVLALQQ